MTSNLRRVLLAALLLTVFTTGIVIGAAEFGQPKSVLHVITLKWKAESSAADRQKALDGVKTMAAQIPGITNVWLKTLKVQGPSQEMQFDAAFVMEFKDEAAFKAYTGDPAHKEWEKIYLPLRDSSRTHDITN